MKIIEGRYFGELTEYLASGGDVVVPTPLPWYPDQLAWQLNVTRKEIRRQEVYFRLHNFLVAETESGSISRQETVSMLPPLVLGVKPHHAVLDMCAAPGSKVSQYTIHTSRGETSIMYAVIVFRCQVSPPLIFG